MTVNESKTWLVIEPVVVGVKRSPSVTEMVKGIDRFRQIVFPVRLSTPVAALKPK